MFAVHHLHHYTCYCNYTNVIIIQAMALLRAVGMKLEVVRLGVHAWTTALHRYINTPDQVPGQDLPRKQWTTFNRLRTGVGRFGALMKKWGLKSTSACECGVLEQTVDHIIDDCPHHRPPNGEQGLINLDDGTRSWLASTELSI